MEEEEELREASSSKEMMKPRWSSSPASYSGDPPAKLRRGRGCFNGGREEGALSWPRVERERVGESEGVRESAGRRIPGEGELG